MSSSVPSDLQGVMTDIQFASGLIANHHLNSKAKTYDRKWLFNAVVRYCQGDSRKETLEYLDGILQKVNECSERYPDRCLFLADEILRLHQTCQRLIDFYGEADDPYTCSKLYVFRRKINETSKTLKERSLLPQATIPIIKSPTNAPADLMSASLPNQLSVSPDIDKFGTPQGEGIKYPESHSLRNE